MDSKGVIYGIAAFALWGLFPIYWSELNDIDPYELLFHRVFWLSIFVGGLLMLKGRISEILPYLKNPKSCSMLLLSSLLIGANWFIFIWGVQVNRVSEVSLGYYINPLINVLIGVVFLGEKLRKWQFFSIFVALIAVVYLTVNMGSLPWISLTLAATFAAYGLVRKLSPIGPALGLVVEAFVVFTLLAGYFIYSGKIDDLQFFNLSNYRKIYLSFAGIVTFTPLFLFVSSAKLVPLSVVGFLQFIAPTLHFLCAKYYLGESFPLYKDISFVMIWFAVLLFLVELYLNFKRRKKELV